METPVFTRKKKTVFTVKNGKATQSPVGPQETVKPKSEAKGPTKEEKPTQGKLEGKQEAHNAQQARPPYNVRLSMLEKAFPALFQKGKYLPLKIGIQKDLCAVGCTGMSNASLRLTLAVYTNKTGYLLALRDGLHRYDINGGEAGEISQSDKENARKRLKLKARRKENQARNVEHRGVKQTRDEGEAKTKLELKVQG